MAKVIAEQLSRPEIVAALLEHRADREMLLNSLKNALLADMRVRAAWLWGSFGRGDADDLSDLDPWIIVADDSVSEMGASLRQYALQTGTFITGGEKPRNAPPGGGFFSSLHEGRHGLLHQDCYWQPQSAGFEVPKRAVLFNRLQKPVTFTQKQPASSEISVALTDEEDRIEGGISFTWLMLSIAAKTLARHPTSDMALMTYPRSGLEEASALLGLGGHLTPSDWLVPESPLAKVELLRHLVGKAAHLTDVANTHGLAISPSNAICLFRYLDMVEEILR